MEFQYPRVVRVHGLEDLPPLIFKIQLLQHDVDSTISALACAIDMTCNPDVVRMVAGPTTVYNIQSTSLAALLEDIRQNLTTFCQKINVHLHWIEKLKIELIFENSALTAATATLINDIAGYLAAHPQTNQHDGFSYRPYSAATGNVSGTVDVTTVLSEYAKTLFDLQSYLKYLKASAVVLEHE